MLKKIKEKIFYSLNLLKILEFQRVGGYTKSRNNFRIAISLNSSQAKVNYLECSGCKSQINIFFS